MNKDERADNYRSLLLLDEISRNEGLTQRDMSKKLGVALGLINSYLKNLVSKGYITVSTIPRKRYKYYLTPSGFAEKTRLTYQNLQNFTNLYRVARRDFYDLFNGLESAKKVVFCGADEVTEIAFLSLREAGLDLAGIVDNSSNKKIFGYSVKPIGSIRQMEFDLVVITSFNSGEVLKKKLVDAGIDEKKICDISRGGWLDKIQNPGGPDVLER